MTTAESKGSFVPDSEPAATRAPDRGGPTGSKEVPRLPFHRPGVVDIAPRYEELREDRPIARVRTPLGDEAWLVTGYAETRRLLDDRRLGRSHPDPATAARVDESGLMSGAVSTYESEAREHARMRAVLGPAFSLRRMRGLTAEIEQMVDGLLDDLAKAGADGGPVNLQEHLSAPLPVMVICRLLGVPYADRAVFKELCERACGLYGEDPMIAMGELQAYIGGLAEQRRAAPADDVISDVVAAQAADGSFSEEDLTGLCAGLLIAGHETTMNHVSLGVLHLLTRPEVRAALVADPGAIAAMVEEMLRVSAPDDSSLGRYAHEDIAVDTAAGPVTIARGEAVLFYTPAANRDPAAFDAPERFLSTRSPNPHLTFGYSNHFCLGAGLARIELQVTLVALVERFPDLRLAVDVAELRLHQDRITGGLHALPVRW